MKSLIIILALTIFSVPAQSQYNYIKTEKTFNHKEDQMPKSLKMKYSRIWTAIGISFIGTGIYLGNTKQNPQGIEIPLIVFGTIFTIEGIRIKN